MAPRHSLEIRGQRESGQSVGAARTFAGGRAIKSHRIQLNYINDFPILRARDQAALQRRHEQDMPVRPKSVKPGEGNAPAESGRQPPHREPLRDLESYPEPFVKTEDLARYWSVSRRQIYKQIESGRLPAIRVGPRTLRIPTRDAVDFEKRLMQSGAAPEAWAAATETSSGRGENNRKTEVGNLRGKSRVR